MFPVSDVALLISLPPFTLHYIPSLHLDVTTAAAKVLQVPGHKPMSSNSMDSNVGMMTPILTVKQVVHLTYKTH